MINISQVDDELVEGEIIESDNEYVQLGKKMYLLKTIMPELKI